MMTCDAAALSSRRLSLDANLHPDDLYSYRNINRLAIRDMPLAAVGDHRPQAPILPPLPGKTALELGPGAVSVRFTGLPRQSCGDGLWLASRNCGWLTQNDHPDREERDVNEVVRQQGERAVQPGRAE